MGILTGLIKLNVRLLLFTLIGVIVIALVPGIPPNHIQFESYEHDTPLKLEGKLAPNTILNNAKVLKLDTDIFQPESLVLRGDELFTGDGRGKIVRIKNGKLSTVAQILFPCDEVVRDRCSFPGGIRFDANGKLVYADAYGGILRVDVDTGKTEQLVAHNANIDNLRIGSPNDLDISKDGTIYFSDASSTFNADGFRNEIFGHPSGRLFKYDPSEDKVTVLLKNLHFANGVQLSQNEDYLLVSELLRYRVIRYYLKGPKKGQHDYFVKGLPGMPDNIRPNGKGGFYISLFSARPPVDLGPYPFVRRFLTRTSFLIDSLTSKLYSFHPSELTKSIYIYGRSFFLFDQNLLRNGFVVELNAKGEILKSLQSTNGNLGGLSQTTIGDKYTYFSSPVNTKIWYVETKDV